MATPAVAREAVCALRRQIAKIEGRLPERFDEAAPALEREADAGLVLRHGGLPARQGLLATGTSKLDAALGGGLPRAALTEIHGRQTRDAGAVAGFALALCVLALETAPAKAPVLWVAAGEAFAEAGRPYAPGMLHRFGLSPETVLVADTRRIEDALWISEEAAGIDGFAAVILEVRGQAKKLDLTATRRLHKRAQTASRPFFLLRQVGSPEPTAAPVRLLVASAPARERPLLSGFLAGSIGPPAFAVEIGRSRTAIPAKAVLEWNRDERAFHEQTDRHDAGSPDPGAVAAFSGERQHPARAAGSQLALRTVA